MSLDPSQRVLLTGAVGGIGAAVAGVPVGPGARLILTDLVSRAAPADTLRGLGQGGGRNCARFQERYGLCRARHVRGRRRWLGAQQRDLSSCRVGFEQWKQVVMASLTTNLPMRLARELTPRMAARGAGSIVQRGSIFAIAGSSFPGVVPHYSASKGNLRTLVRWSAGLYGSDVGSNGVAPGIANASFISDAILGVNGAAMMRL